MKITYVPLNPDATGFYRVISPGRQLALHGHTVRVPFEEERDEKNDRFLWKMDIEKMMEGDETDLWCIQMRWERHWVTGVMHDLRRAGKATVVECDDNYLETPEWNPAFYGNHPYRMNEGYIRNREMRRRGNQRMVKAKTGQKVKVSVAANLTSATNRHHGFEMMKQADAVIVSTPYLAEIYSKFNSNVRVVRNYVDWDLWEDIQPQYQVERERLRIGYFGAFAYRRGDLAVIKEVIPRVLKRHPEVDFVANSEGTLDFLGVPKGQRIDIGEYAFYQGRAGDFPVGEKTATCDIGLVPLLPGGMAEGKSHLKGMEYNAAGIPFIASPTESYDYWTEGTSFIGDTRNGFLATTEREWEEQLEYLITHDDSRRRMGEAGREKAEQHSIQNRWRDWERAFSDVLGTDTDRLARGAIKRGAVQKISELSSLLKLVSVRKPRTVVEVGSARGGTFWALSQVASVNALLVSIDIPAGSPLDVRGGKDVYGGRDRERLRTYVRDGQRCKLIDGNSQDQRTVEMLLDTIGIDKIDVLLIDADHRYQGVKRDYELYSPLVKHGGIIAFHDVIPQNDVRSGVHMLWNQLKLKHPSSAVEYVGKDNWGLGSWGGIGVIFK